MKIGSKLGLAAAIGALVVAVPATAKPGEHHPNKPSHPPQSHKCTVPRLVAYRASGTLVSFDATKNSDGTYSGTITIHVTNANHFAKRDKGTDVTYTLTNSKVTFGHGANPPAAGDRVTVIGKVEVLPKKCGHNSGKITIHKVNVHTASKSKNK